MTEQVLNESWLERARAALALALDVPDRAKALELARSVTGGVGVVKVGLELFLAEGPSLVSELTQMGLDVFLDLKFHDIPATVERAARAAGRLGVSYLTVHAGEGPSLVAAAVRGAAQGALTAGKKAPIVLAVTVLTSLTREELASVGLDRDLAELVELRAERALDAGAGGLVCSPLEVERLRVLGSEHRLVVPGIRPSWALVAGDDQARVSGPGQAIQAGADLLVVGRPIRDADDPGKAARRIVEEVASALRARQGA